MPDGVRNQFTPLIDFKESETSIIMGMIEEVKRGKGWSRIEALDETGEASFFHKEDTLIEPGNMYAMLIANKRLARYIEIEDFVRGSSNTFVKFVYTKNFNLLTEGFYYVVSNKTRVTKAGKNMADLVLCDADKNLYSALVFPGMYHKAYGYCKEGSVVEAKLKKTQDGDSYFLEEVIPR
jgi:hypothetical protein